MKCFSGSSWRKLKVAHYREAGRDGGNREGGKAGPLVDILPRDDSAGNKPTVPRRRDRGYQSELTNPATTRARTSAAEAARESGTYGTVETVP